MNDFEYHLAGARFGEDCDYCFAAARPVTVDDTTLYAVDHEDSCPVVAPSPPPRRGRGRR